MIVRQIDVVVVVGVVIKDFVDVPVVEEVDEPTDFELVVVVD
jgi:hypothetical protein